MKFIFVKGRFDSVLCCSLFHCDTRLDVSNMKPCLASVVSSCHILTLAGQL